MDLDFLSLNKNEAGILKGLQEGLEGPRRAIGMGAAALLPYATLSNPRGIHVFLSRLEGKGMIRRAGMDGKAPLFRISVLGRLMMDAWKHRENIRIARREEGEEGEEG